MKLHTDTLATKDIFGALLAAESNGQVTSDIAFVKFDKLGSRQRSEAYEIQLGTYDKTSGPTKSRHYKNSGNQGSTSPDGSGDQVWAATWEEWGWFIAEIFNRDPDAIFGTYRGVNDFHAQTHNKFRQIVKEWP